MLVSVSVFVSVLCGVSVGVDQSVTVHTKYGDLRGLRTAVDDQFYVDKYLGIPYAKPPVGPRRFQKPEMVEAWSGVREATSLPSQCPQLPSLPPFEYNDTFTNDEDCLYLNVYTPVLSASKSSGLLPVMVFVHGGAFYSGTGGIYKASPLTTKGVVVVTINYRIGALGFLSTEDDVAPGNFGLWDQIQALKWVRDAISAFNGDPNDVTLFGESAGSASVSLLVLSTASQGLYKKAIMESAVSLSGFSTSAAGQAPEHRKLAFQLGSLMDCDVTDSSVLLQCLRTKDWRRLLDVSSNMTNLLMAFRPSIESTFQQPGILTDLPSSLLANGRSNNITVIRGFNTDEGSIALDAIFTNQKGATVEEFKGYARGFFQLRGAQNVDTIVQRVFDAYVTNTSDPYLIRAAASKFGTDFAFLEPTIREFQLAAKGGMTKQYLYRFSYRSPNRMNPSWQGVAHGDELHYVFGAPVVNEFLWNNFVSSWTEADRRVSETVMTLWTNFAKYGNPTPDDYKGPRWQPWLASSPRLMDLNVNATMMDFTYPASLQRLWTDVIPKLFFGNSGGVIG